MVIFTCLTRCRRIQLQGPNRWYRSLFLELQLPVGQWEAYHICAQFAIVSWDPKDPGRLLKWRIMSHRFEAPLLRAGFESFPMAPVPLSERRPNDDIESGQYNLTVYLRVFEDPSNSLWKHTRDYNIRPRAQYPGLVNQGATGYMQWVLLNLFHIPALRQVRWLWYFC